MIKELLKHDDYLRVLKALERKPLRFTELQKTLKLNPTQVNRALSFLKRGLWIIPKTLPTEKGPIPVAYHLGKRGKAFLGAFESFIKILRRTPELDPSEVSELSTLSK